MALVRSVSRLILATLALFAVGAAPTRAADSSEKCAASKLKAAGKEVGDKMVCYAKAKKASTGVDSTCLDNAKTKADARINKAGTGCPGTTTEIDFAVDSCVAAFLNDDPNDGACPAASAKAIGKGAKAQLSCQAKELEKPGSFTACDAKEDAKTSARLTNAGGCVDPNSVAADIDDCNAAFGYSCSSCDTSYAAAKPAGYYDCSYPGGFGTITAWCKQTSGYTCHLDYGNCPCVANRRYCRD